jgi:hypothetical protein
LNERPPVSRLREAMERADLHALDEAAEAIGRQAVQIALAEAQAPALIDAKADDRQRDLDAALADAIEVVSRHRARLGRRVCSRHDGEATRKVWELLRGMLGPDAGGDSDPSFQ